MDNYIDENGLMHLKPLVGDLSDILPENAILYTAQNSIAFPDRWGYRLIRLACKHYWNKDIKMFEVNAFEGWSHDNHTALVSLSKRYGMDYHNKHYWAIQRSHPRDLIFYTICRDDLWRFIGYLFMPILSIIMIEGAIRKYKVRQGVKILKTDGLLLSWVRFNTIKMPLTKMIITFIVNRRFGSWNNVFKEYFKLKGHPNRAIEMKPCTNCLEECGHGSCWSLDD